MLRRRRRRADRHRRAVFLARLVSPQQLVDARAVRVAVGALLGHRLAHQVLLEQQPVLRRVGLFHDACERVVHTHARLTQHDQIRLGDRDRLLVVQAVQPVLGKLKHPH